MRTDLTRRFMWAVLGLSLTVAVGCSNDSDKPKPRPQPSVSGDGDAPAETTEPATTPDAAAPATSGSGGGAAPTAGGWGTISGAFKYDGEAPEQMKINVTKDIEFCSMKNPLTEQIVVNSENKGIKNMVIMLYLGRGDEAPQAHESYTTDAPTKINMDNEWCRFEPHVQFVQAGQTVEFGNEDEVGHNVKGEPFANPAFNQTVAAGGAFEVALSKPETLPVQVTCTIHPWMSGWLVVQDHPYVAVSDDDGNFELKNVPSGTWTFQIWQEQSGYLKQLKVKGADTKLTRGRWEVNVYDEAQDGNADKNAFGDILVPASNF